LLKIVITSLVCFWLYADIFASNVARSLRHLLMVIFLHVSCLVSGNGLSIFIVRMKLGTLSMIYYNSTQEI